jgi:hypothetical protein
MSKCSKELSQREAESFEIIETAIDDLELLKKAFDVVKEVCEELDGPAVSLEQTYPSRQLIN